MYNLFSEKLEKSCDDLLLVEKETLLKALKWTKEISVVVGGKSSPEKNRWRAIIHATNSILKEYKYRKVYGIFCVY